MKFLKYIIESNDTIIKKIEKSRFDSDRKLVKVNVKAFDKAWSKDRDFYVGKGGTGASIGDRYQRFQDILKMSEEERKRWLGESPKGNIIASSVGVSEDGSVYFDNGRHRFAVLRDMGYKEIPVAMTKESIKNAKKHGYIK